MKRKWLALGLAGTLVLGTLAGCGNSGSGTSGQESSAQEASSQEAEPAEQGGVKRLRSPQKPNRPRPRIRMRKLL